MSALTAETIRLLIREEVGAPLKELKETMAGMKAKLDGQSEEIVKLERKVKVLEEVKGKLAERVKRLEDREEYMEARSRRNTLMFFGIPDQAGETWEQTERKVKEVLKERGMPHDARMERCHRDLKPYREGYTRHVRAMFSFFKDKEEVLRSRRRLAGTRIRIDEDLPYEMRRRRDRLRDYAMPICIQRRLRMQLKYPFKEVSIGNETLSFEQVGNAVGGSEERSGANSVPLGEKKVTERKLSGPSTLLANPTITPHKRRRTAESPSPKNAPKVARDDPPQTTKVKGPGRPKTLEKAAVSNRRLSEFFQPSQSLNRSQSIEDIYLSPSQNIEDTAKE